jgi:hypothetical protein
VSRLAPWLGWIGGIAGWFVSQQLGSNLAQLDCDAANLVPMLLLGVLGLVLAAAGGFTSWSVWRRRTEQPEARSRSFIAATGALAALVFALAIVFQTGSSFVIPQCHA